jgi:hypothetical protein
MPSIRDYLDRMVVSATSPDGNVQATVSNYTECRVEFRPMSFARYDEEALAHQLSRLGALTWVAYRRGRTQAFRDSQRLTEVPTPPEDPRLRGYEEALARLDGSGVSASRVLHIGTIGMAQWTVEITPGALRRLGEASFLAEIHSAIEDLINDRKAKVILLKAEHLDLGIPRRWRDLTIELTAANRGAR